MTSEIETKRKELEKGCNANSALLGINCGQQYEENYEIYYCNRCENKIDGFNLGVEMARKEFLDILNRKFEDTLSSLDERFCKDEKDIQRKNVALVIYDELREKLKQSLEGGKDD